MLKINGKVFLNIQEAVGWLLDNNALPFQCSANYVANTEIGMGTIVNPSPAKVRIGSLIFFADSKVSTVVGLTENGFIVSDHYNDLVDDIVYVSNVALNASGHLIVTLSNGDTIDAGLIKQVSNFTINASQHLIVNFNDGTSTDLGAIFSGNVNIAGNLTANSIIENMSGYSFAKQTPANYDITPVYAGAVKNGNKVTFVLAFEITKRTGGANEIGIGNFEMPYAVCSKLYPSSITGVLDTKTVDASTSYNNKVSVDMYVNKSTSTNIAFALFTNNLVVDTTYYIRYEATFLLSNNMAS